MPHRVHATWPLAAQMRFWARQVAEPASSANPEAVHRLVAVVGRAADHDRASVIEQVQHHLTATHPHAAAALAAAVAAVATMVPLDDPPDGVGLLLWVPLVLQGWPTPPPGMPPALPASGVDTLLHQLGWIAPPVQARLGSVWLPSAFLTRPLAPRRQWARRLFTQWWGDDPLLATVLAAPDDARAAGEGLRLRFVPLALRIPPGCGDPGPLPQAADPTTLVLTVSAASQQSWTQAMTAAWQPGLPSGAWVTVGLPAPWDAALGEGSRQRNAVRLHQTLTRLVQQHPRPVTAAVACRVAAAVEWRVGLAAADGAFVGFTWPCGPGPAADLTLLLSGLAAAGVHVLGVDPTPAPADTCPDCGAPLFPDPTQLAGPLP